MSVFLTKIVAKIVESGMNILNCIVIYILCVIAIKISKRIIKRFFTLRLSKSHTIMDERKANTMISVTSSIVKYVFYFIAICAMLTVFDIDVRSIIAVAGIGSIAVGFGAQSLVKDFITGFFILFEDQYAIGDYVTISGNTGYVEGISMRLTKVRSIDGKLHLIPNGNVSTVTNMSKGYMNAIIKVGIAYEENVDRAIKVLKDEMSIVYKELEGLRKEPAVLGVSALSDSAVTITIVAECEIGYNFVNEREILRRIKIRFDKEDISIPYPQTTVHVKNQ